MQAKRRGGSGVCAQTGRDARSARLLPVEHIDAQGEASPGRVKRFGISAHFSILVGL